MENIANTRSRELDSNLLHTNYQQCEQERHQTVINNQQQLVSTIQDREKCFSVNHLLELPGQPGHPMYNTALHDNLEHHQRGKSFNLLLYLTVLTHSCNHHFF